MKTGIFRVAVNIVLLCSACSTPPKNPGDSYTVRRRAETQLDLGNKQADRGNLADALLVLDEARRLAVTSDDPALRIRVTVSRSNVLFLLGRGEEAESGWNEALVEAERTENAELAALCRIHIGWGTLLAVKLPRGPERQSSAQLVRDAVVRDINLIKADRLSIAFAWTVAALAEKELGRYANAEAAVQRSLEIHEKARRFELAAYDWYMIASFRSLAGNFGAARQALETAIAFDRRVENSWGLAIEWRALGDVHTKASDIPAAHAAYRRASEIFRALGNEAAAADTLARIENR